MGWLPFFTSTIEPERLDWVLERWQWLMAHSGGLDGLSRTELVLPTPEFFPISATDPGGKVAQTFEIVRDRFGMKGWPFRLQPSEEASSCCGVSWAPPGAGNPQDADWQGATIRFRPQLVQDPQALVASFARDLAMCRLLAIAAPPPGNPEDREQMADLLAVHSGFGIFLANAAFQFRKSCCGGCAVSRVGILDQQTLSLGLALFCVLKKIPVKKAKPFLSVNPRSYVADFAAALEKRHATQLARLR